MLHHVRGFSHCQVTEETAYGAVDLLPRNLRLVLAKHADVVPGVSADANFRRARVHPFVRERYSM